MAAIQVIAVGKYEGDAACAGTHRGVGVRPAPPRAATLSLRAQRPHRRATPAFVGGAPARTKVAIQMSEQRQETNRRRLELNEQYGPLRFEEWVVLIQSMERLSNGHPSGERLRDILRRLCEPHGLDWRELWYEYTDRTGVVAAECWNNEWRSEEAEDRRAC